MIEPCRYAGDTGTYIFKATFVSGAATRYDPTVWIAADGGNALTGSCYKDYLNPTTNVTLSVNLLSGKGPYRSEEYSTVQPYDTCGDIIQNEQTVKLIGPITITCSQTMLDTKTINTIIGWDNQVSYNCPANKGCPSVSSKCNNASSPMEVNLNIVDLRLIKEASTAAVHPGDTITFTFTVVNNSAQFPSTGYTITDTLLKDLNFVSASPSVCSANLQPDGLELVTCNMTADLGPLGTAPVITITVKVGENYTGPSPITNRACVKGNEFEHDGTVTGYPSTMGDNCDDANVPTAVELVSFTANPVDDTIFLDWETAIELDNLGFNIYRSTSNQIQDGLRVNTVLIPANNPPGSLLGSTYTYTDKTVEKNVIYYYWLEGLDLNGTATMYGPVIAHLKFANQLFLPLIQH